ncbi:hypothetical protein BRC68_04235 [Halobacteriales archaeon QH_6_64_20]|nr:MAG: hypothetical protein BRC68_04235 [Halobacteriales archaeon QH_6_64_20]
MSDFDEEAEREKLREQFAADEEKRETTERMSELLLQGATMTNRHCDTCSSPIFTYQGQAFCPTCQVEVGDSGGQAGGQNAAGANANTGQAEPTTGVDNTAGDPDAARSNSEVDASGDVGSPTRIEVDDPGNDAGSRSSTPASPSATDPGSTTGSASTTEPARAPTGSAGGTGTETGAGTGDTELGAAQASLSRTLARLSGNAEESEDLSQTRNYLLAAREAADALAALKEARR